MVKTPAAKDGSPPEQVENTSHGSSFQEDNPPGRTTLGRFVGEHWGELLAYARSWRRRHGRRQSGETQDELHDALSVLYERKRPVRGRTHLFGLCRGFLRNVLRERWRRERAAKRGGGRRKVTLSEDLAPSVRDGSPLEASVGAEEREEIQRVLSRLDERDRRLILLRIWKERDWADIARELGYDSADAARMRYARVMQKLRERWESGRDSI